MTTKSHEPDRSVPRESISISSDTDLWIRQYIKLVELHLLEASRDLPPEPGVSESQEAAARAVFKTFLDSGLDLNAVVELLGRVAVEEHSRGAGWTDELNQRRFDLIDKEIQGTLTPGESLELAGLTRIMRDHVDTEANLPLEVPDHGVA